MYQVVIGKYEKIYGHSVIQYIKINKYFIKGVFYITRLKKLGTNITDKTCIIYIRTNVNGYKSVLCLQY